MLRLAQTRYPDVNHTHLSELLREREGIEIGRTTLRHILVAAGMKSPRLRQSPRHRVRLRSEAAFASLCGDSPLGVLSTVTRCLISSIAPTAPRHSVRGVVERASRVEEPPSWPGSVGIPGEAAGAYSAPTGRSL